MVAQTAGFKGARKARSAGSTAVGGSRGRPEMQPVAQQADQVVQFVDQLQQAFHWPEMRRAQRRGAPGGDSAGSSPFSMRQAVRTLSAQDL